VFFVLFCFLVVVLVWTFFYYRKEKVLLVQIPVRKEQRISFGLSLPETRYVSDVC